MQLERNTKQVEALYAILNNTADYEKEGKGKYQTGFKATLNWSRATGKTFQLLDLVAISANTLHRAVSGIWSATYRSVQNIILSQSSTIWAQHGLTEFDEKNNPYGNYVINRKPPRHFHKPYNSPRDYENTISFAKGYMAKMLSADRPDTQRGDNFDQLFGDEVGFTKKDFYTKILLPSLRANKRVYHDPRPGRKGYNHPLHWLSVNFSSLPYSMSGRWFLEMEELMKAESSKYFFQRANAYDNLENLPGDFIDSQKKELSDIEFQVEIMNQLNFKVGNGFYASFDDSKHVITNYVYQFAPEKRQHITVDRMYDTMKAIDMSWDFNGYFTCCTISQDFDDEYIFNNEYFAKESTSTLIESVCDNFIEDHKHHLKKVIYLYGDNSGNNKNPDRNLTLFQSIKSKLTFAGWVVIDRVQNTYPSYKARYTLINKMLSESESRYPKIRLHAEKCTSLTASLNGAKIRKDTLEKDKSNEAKEDFPQEFATHFTDAFDYLIYSKFSSLSDFTSSRKLPIKLTSR